ncbi:MAG: DUF1513 domain-containing protein [Sterolibacterium sp.]|nr:DUF1513 domain-containing protein [Sterolibacterium sp.]
MRRRQFLWQLSALLGSAALPGWVAAATEGRRVRVGGGWRMNGQEFQIGALQVDWAEGRLTPQFAVTTPTLPHAIVPEAGGGFLAVATRPGTWMLRVDAEGRVSHRIASVEEGDVRTFDGHVIASHDGQWLYTGETDRKSGEGWVSVRDARDMRKVAEHRTHGIDPHQILVDAEGRLIVANGGIPRTPTGDKRNLERMQPNLVRMDAGSGEKLGEWSLRDKRLSPHHIAWNQPTASSGKVLLGLGLQAEHDDPAQRREAPVLAIWDGQTLEIPSHVVADGYAGDVAAGPDGGFVLTAQRANRIVLWRPQQAAELLTIGEVQNPCGLWPLADAPGVAIGGGLGLARWHPRETAQMMRWPTGMAAGNHWALLA